MHEQHLDNLVLKLTGIESKEEPDHIAWSGFLEKLDTAEKNVTIGLVGKYVELQDAYKSISESLMQAATYCNRKLKLVYIHSEKIDENNIDEKLSGLDGVIIAPGFGQRGIEGKFIALKWCRTHDIPTFGICLGMQCMVIEYARNVLGLKDANSTEMDPDTPDNVIDIMEEQKKISNMGGTMRLGAYECKLKKGSIPAEAYGMKLISERHRHRYEYNMDYRDRLEAAGMECVGENPDTGLVEIVQVPALRWFVGTQYHPEYQSTVLHPNPLFMSFMKAAIKKSEESFR